MKELAAELDGLTMYNTSGCLHETWPAGLDGNLCIEVKSQCMILTLRHQADDHEYDHEGNISSVASTLQGVTEISEYLRMYLFELIVTESQGIK